MKKLISILIFLVTASLGASAQWYNFPINKEKQKTEQKAEQKVEQIVEQKAEPEIIKEEELNAPVTPDPANEEYSSDMPEVINVAMLLPIQTAGKANSNYLEMYAGGLLALRDLGAEGTKVNLSIFDSADEDKLITPEMLAGSDVIIGPVSTGNILEILSRCPDGKRIISPLEPKVAALTDSCNVVQAPSSWADQIDGMLDWIRDDMIPGDDLVLVKDSSETTYSEQTRYLISRLEASGLKYKTSRLASDIPASAIGTTRYIVASDRDSYIATAIRQIGIASATLKSGSKCVYLTSKMRNAKGIDQQYLYKAGARVTMSYFTDYNDRAVKDFILAYRSLYSDEPASFAFQGYDTVRYFVGACAKYGRQWYMKLPETGLYKGLQTNFEFKECDKAGQMNRAVKRVVYNPDMSTTVQ